MATGVIGFLFVAMYAGLQTNTSIVHLCQENQIATQVLTEKFETIRLYNWDQVRSNGFVPPNFVVNLDPGNTNSRPFYTGTVNIARAPYAVPYSNELRLVTVKLDWTSGNRPCSREMTSLVTRHGLHTYVNK